MTISPYRWALRRHCLSPSFTAPRMRRISTSTTSSKPTQAAPWSSATGAVLIFLTRENILTCPKNIQHRLRAAAGQPVLAAGRVSAGAARAAAPEAAAEEPRQVLLGLQVSCDWWRAGHVTTVLTLIGSPGVCSSPPTWPPGASTSPTLNTSSTIRS